MTYDWFFSMLEVRPLCGGPDRCRLQYPLAARRRRWEWSFRLSYMARSGCTYTEGDPFIPFADLTKSDVEGWTTTNLGDDQVDELKAQIDGMIAEEITPTTEEMTPPWQNGG